MSAVRSVWPGAIALVRHESGEAVDPWRASFLVVALAAVLASPWLATLDPSVRVAAFAILVLALGLPHGALDAPVARALGLWSGPAELSRFVLLYVAIAMATLLAWTLAPGPVLAALLTLSAAHFRHDWEGAVGAVGSIGIVGWPALWHREEVTAIFALLSTPAAGATIAPGAAWMGAAALVALPWLARRALRSAAQNGATVNARWDAIEVAVLAVLAAALHPLLFFAAYFCALHSPRHARDVMATHGPSVRRQAHIVGLCALTAVSLIGGGALLMSRHSGWPDADAAWTGAVFAGLLCLTVPHVLLVERRAATV